MILSMTGFGRAEAREDGRFVTVEIRSVNHRFLEVSVRLPRTLSVLEPKVRERVQGVITRGKVGVTVAVETDPALVSPARLNREMAARYVEIGRVIAREFGLQGQLEVPDLMALPDVVGREPASIDEEAEWAVVSGVLERAIEGFQTMRRAEGQAMERDLLERVRVIRGLVGEIERRAPEVVSRAAERLRARVEELSKDVEYNRMRLEMELALLADRADVTEECVRLNSHCEQFERICAGREPGGRRLNFVVQEMHREANTIGSKSQDLEIGEHVLSLKEEIERIREQVQNVE